LRIDELTETAVGSSATETKLACGTVLTSTAAAGALGPRAAGAQADAANKQIHVHPARGFSIDSEVRPSQKRDLKNLRARRRVSLSPAFVSEAPLGQATHRRRLDKATVR
jgi:hypothetical protein